MTTNDKIVIYNHITGETVVREMTDEEQLQRNTEVNAWLLEEQEKSEAKIEQLSQRQALLDKLGITEEEAKLLLGGN